MKKIIYLSAFLLMLTTSLFAQSTETTSDGTVIINESWPLAPNTIIKERTTHGIYLASSLSYGRVGKKDLVQASTRLGYIADSKFDFSFVAQGLATEKAIFDTEQKNEFLVAGIGGFQIEPILFGKKIVNISFPLFLGGGAAALTTDNSDNIFDCGPLDSDEWEPIFVAQPGINAVVNITRFLQFEVGAKYRVTSDLVFRDTNFGNLNGVNLGAGIKLGYFAFGKKRRH